MYLFFIFVIVIFWLHAVGIYYAIKLRKDLRLKYPWEIDKIGTYGWKFANSICKDWPDITDTDVLILKRKVKLIQSVMIIMFFVFPVILFFISMIINHLK
jgi:hypothetical protein